MRIVGLDLSLTSTGCAEWENGTYESWHHGRGGKNTDTLKQRKVRLEQSRDESVGYGLSADLVLVESHTFAAKGGSQHDRSGLWWLVVHALIDEGVEVVEVAPSSIKLFATGKGNASKDEVVLATARRHPNILFTTNDEADALNLVDMGLAHWSHEYLDPTAYQQRALDKVVWP